ncbi:MAG TPA: hypothetical protein VN771_03050 [Candidatus Baltobacteraceae bacterium]|nr:hypothetical protein [Candidatus Baltobacteraceae bacterium]
MLATLRAMPNGVRVFLAYALVVLAILGLTLPLIVAEASSDVPISPLGLVWMALLAYLIFTMTLVLQRKQAAWGLSLGLVTLVVPLVPLLLLATGLLGALFAVALGLVLLRGLLRPEARLWFSET